VKLFHPVREAVLEGGTAMLFVMSGRAEVSAAPDGGLSYGALMVPRSALRELVANAEDRFGKALHPSLPALRHLKRYLDFVKEPDLVGDEPALTEHVETTILDLVALALGAGRDASRIAGMRGLRAARAQEIIAEIRARFADPTFSPRDIELKLGLSPRYVQELMQETGSSLGERVLELRLQRARQMLTSPRHDRLKIVEIAYAAGFNEVSYFNRCFRRRFGDSPMGFRGKKAVG
jgi:AraC-like DNA-binding protein